jgi:hypothetical protein
MITLSCPACAATQQVPAHLAASLADKLIACPKCKAKFKLKAKINALAPATPPTPKPSSADARPRLLPAEKAKPLAALAYRTRLWVFGSLISMISILGLAGYFAWQCETLRQQLETAGRDLRARTQAAETAAHALSAIRKEVKQSADENKELKGKLAETEKHAQTNQKSSEQAIEGMKIELAAARRSRDEAIEDRRNSKKLLDAAEARAEELFGLFREERKRRKDDNSAEEAPARQRLKLLLPEPLATHALDQYALRAPPEAEATPKDLAKYLSEPARNDRDRVRAAYIWITDRIAYDTDAFFAKRRSAEASDDVLRNRKCVCAGYAQLFDDLCKRMGGQTAVVTGYASGIEDDNTAGENHAWNAVILDGKWFLVDATWGSGFLEGKRFSKRYNDVYFLTPPERMIFTHLPTEVKWQLLDRPVSRKEFESFNKMAKNLDVFSGRFEEIRRRLADGTFRGFPKVNPHPASGMIVHKGPLERYLVAGAGYYLKIEAANLSEMAVKNGANRTPLSHYGTFFEGKLQPQAGPLLVLGRLPNMAADVSLVLMEYVVE